MKIKTVLIAILGIAFTSVCLSGMAAESKSKNQKTAKSVLNGPPAEELVKQFTKSMHFPVAVDEMTQLEAVSGKGDTLTYSFGVIPPSKDKVAVQKLAASIKAGFPKSACESKNFSLLLVGGYSIVLNYSFGDPTYDVQVTVLPGSCGH